MTVSDNYEVLFKEEYQDVVVALGKECLCILYSFDM